MNPLPPCVAINKTRRKCPEKKKRGQNNISIHPPEDRCKGEKDKSLAKLLPHTPLVEMFIEIKICTSMSTTHLLLPLWKGRNRLARASPSEPRNRDGRNFSGSSHTAGSLLVSCLFCLYHINLSPVNGPVEGEDHGGFRKSPSSQVYFLHYPMRHTKGHHWSKSHPL